MGLQETADLKNVLQILIDSFAHKIFADHAERSLFVENKKNDVISARRKIVGLFDEDVDATIGIVAYNRLDVTELCVKSVLENTKDINYKLVLVYNENEQGKGILEYFNSVEYKNKVVVHIKQNAGAPFAYQQIQKHIEGKYFVHLPNDVIVTPNWLSNLIKCAESDDRIGMVNPVSSNVSNLQCVDLEFSSYDEMQKKAAEYNVSDPLKWQERLRLITLGTLLTRECLLAIGTIFDCGFMHDFGDDDLSFRVRRAGYKIILAADTWVHHNHNMSERNPEQFNNSIAIGKENFYNKYYGIDAWEDVNNYVSSYIQNNIEMPNDFEDVNILGIDVKCGTPVLDIKNIIRQYNVFDPCISSFSTDSKYYMDLKTICDGQVVCDRIDFLYNSFKANNFDYIIIGQNINEYSQPESVIRDAYALLKPGGEMFVSLKNTYNIFTLLESLGYGIGCNETARHYKLETFCQNILNMGIKIELINQELYAVDKTVDNYVLNIVKQFKADNKEALIYHKLKVKNYWLKIKKNV